MKGRLWGGKTVTAMVIHPNFKTVTVTFSGNNPVLPFLAFSVLPRKNLKFTKDFLSLPNPQNPWKRQRKYQNNQGNSLLKINQGNPKNQGTEGQGNSQE